MKIIIDLNFLNKLIEILESIGNVKNPLLIYFPFLCILHPLFEVIAENEDGRRVALDVVEILQEVYPSLIVNLLTFLHHHS